MQRRPKACIVFSLLVGVVVVAANLTANELKRGTATVVKPDQIETWSAGVVSPDESPHPREQAEAPADASAFDIGWQSVNGGGRISANVDYAMRLSIGQSAIGSAATPVVYNGVGFWYGLPREKCECPYQSDFDEDEFLTALDLSAMIDILFAGAPDVQDPLCPSPRADFDCDGFSTALDMSALIDHLFSGGDGPCDPCAP